MDPHTGKGVGNEENTSIISVMGTSEVAGLRTGRERLDRARARFCGWGEIPTNRIENGCGKKGNSPFTHLLKVDLVLEYVSDG